MSKPNKRSKRKSKSRRRARRARRRELSEGPVQVVWSLDGGPVEDDCSCPVCAEMAAAGIPRVTTGPDGELVELPATEAPPMIEVTVRGTASTWPELPPEPRAVAVPVGCIVRDLLAYLGYKNQAFAIAFSVFDLTASIGGVLCEWNRVLCCGDEVVVSGVRDPVHESLMQSILTPWPDTDESRGDA